MLNKRVENLSILRLVRNGHARQATDMPTIWATQKRDVGTLRCFFINIWVGCPGPRAGAVSIEVGKSDPAASGSALLYGCRQATTPHTDPAGVLMGQPTMNWEVLCWWVSQLDTPKPQEDGAP